MNGMNRLQAKSPESPCRLCCQATGGQGERLTLAVPQFSHMESGDKNILPHRGCSKDYRNSISEALCGVTYPKRYYHYKNAQCKTLFFTL